MSVLDLDALVKQAAEGAAAKILAALPDVIRGVLDERNERLEPLADILEITTDAALKREKRNPALKALAVATRGRQRLYRRASVCAWLAGQVKP